MLSALVLIAIVGLAIAGAVVVGRASAGSNNKKVQEEELADAIAEARRWNERLGSQVLTMTGTDAASTQVIADAAERHTAAASQIASATTVRQAQLARESALEGLHYMYTAREIMGLPTGPEIPPLEGQKAAGKVSEERTINHEGHEITASPHPSAQTPNYYPGGTVAGRPVPAGWYSEPWWASALRTGAWAAGSAMLFSMMFSGMAGVASAAAFESGVPDFDAGEAIGGEEGGFFDGIFGDEGFFGGDGGGFDFDF